MPNSSTPASAPLGAPPTGGGRTVETRLAAAAAEIKKTPALEAGKILLLPAFFAWTPLPLKETNARYAERLNGKDRVVFSSGLPETNLPYGSYARHLIAWLLTCCAIRKVDTVYLQQDITVFWRAFTANPQKNGRPGGKRRALIEDQVNRIATMSINSVSARRRHQHVAPRRPREVLIEKVAGTQIVESVLRERDIKTGQATTTEMTFRYHDGLQTRYPLFPVDRRAWIALANRPFALDVYAWACYKNATMRKREMRISWSALTAQFLDLFSYGPGQEPQQPSRVAKCRFPARFKEALGRVRVVYPELIVRPDKDGVIFYKTRPHVPPAPVNKSIRLRRQQTNRFVLPNDPAKDFIRTLS